MLFDNFTIGLQTWKGVNDRLFHDLNAAETTKLVPEEVLEKTTNNIRN